MVSLSSALVCMALSGVGQTEMLDFSAVWCGPCRQMQPTVDALIAQGHPIRKVDIDQDKALTQRFRVTGVPCFVMLVDGREVDRVEGMTSRARLEQMLRRGPPRAAAAPPNPQPAPPGVPFPGQVSGEPLAALAPSSSQSPHRQALSEAGATLAANTQSADKCLAAGVRLKIEDPTGNSVGSGTVIDARDGEALILTCGHIFRESKGKGKILIDLFGPGAPKGLTGELVGYDLKRDVGLVSFHPTAPITAAPLAPAEFVVNRGDEVINVGCDNGREPTARTSRVTGIDKYLGPPNVEVAGQPVEGRSGGGLFTPDGKVIGVCNAADPADNEGLYAGIASIHAELARLGLSQLVAAAPAAASSGAPPAMAGVLPVTQPPAAPARVVQTSADGLRRRAGGQEPVDLPTKDSAARGDAPAQQGAEVICIVRALDDPRAKSEVIVLDRASPDFLRQLSVDRGAQDARHQTSLGAQPGAQAAREAVSREPVLTADSWAPQLGPRRFK
ncbi:MAG: trypsin-like peptidase domain-containing protein [Planctomycetia bacterium]|nr:trypsin-like peptidase domain-containing protein [Planctomycetia bacterium]